MNYIENKRHEYEESKLYDEKFRRFCVEVYESKSLLLEEAEKKHFEELRESEHKDYVFRKKVFWPLCGISLLLYDQLITMPGSRSNKGRILLNVFLGIPFVGIVCSGLVFYREKVESQEYAITLCEKYKSCTDSLSI